MSLADWVVVEIPATRYAAVGDADVAYQAFGQGQHDLLYFIGMGSHIDLMWDSPQGREFIVGLASVLRVARFDRRGTGASGGDREAPPSWEEWTEDIHAVLDAAGFATAAVFAELDAGPVAMLFAAMHPERVSALVLANTTARYRVDNDYPIGLSSQSVDDLVGFIASAWGTEDLIRMVAPSLARDAEYVRSSVRGLRAAASPRTAEAHYRYVLETLDVRRALPVIQVPTLVLHNEGNPLVPIEHGRYIAEHIPGAKLVVLPSSDIDVASQVPRVVDEIMEFLTGERPVVMVERILTTVLFTDIVSSTERLVSMGDRRWRAVLDAHDRAVRDEVRRFGGKEINTTGDGFVVSFDGPARAIRCAQAIIETTRNLDIELRTGLHTGECEVRSDDLGGFAIHLAARVGSVAASGEVLVSRTVVDLVAGSGIEFEDRGEHELKGVPGRWRLYAVTG